MSEEELSLRETLMQSAGVEADEIETVEPIRLDDDPLADDKPVEKVDAIEKVDEKPPVTKVKDPVKLEADDVSKKAENANDEEKPEPESVEKPEARAASEIKPPRALTGDRKKDWNELPPAWQEEIVRLETTQQKGVQKLAAEARYGADFKQMVDPYRATLQAAGVDEKTVVSRLLNANYILKTGSPAEKAQALAGVAQEYGVPLQDIQQPANIDPQMQYLIDQNRQLQQYQQDQQHQAQQTVQTQAQNEVESFATDPMNEHYDLVKVQMADLIEAKLYATLPDAYNAACKLQGLQIKTVVPDPDPVAPVQPGQEPQKVTPKEPSATVKKNAATSLKGGSGESAKKVPEGADLRKTLEAQMYGESARV